MGFVEFCERQPGDCGDVGAPELGRMRLAAEAARSNTAVAAISYDWTPAFAQLRQPPPAANPVKFDWTGVFPQAQVAADPATEEFSRSVEKRAATVMNRDTWELLQRVNQMVNVEITPRDDVMTYGVADYWATPLETGLKSGDCEDFVLEKRHQLIAGGVPASALSIAVVLTEKGESHAVLLVATSTGEYVLDNRTPWILPWSQTTYRWRERQVAGSASRWAFAAATRAPGSAPPRFLLASAR